MADNQKELLANIAPFGLRMQADLKDRLKAASEENGRSMNAEIVARLEASFTNKPKTVILTEEEKEDLWRWMQERAKAEREWIANVSKKT
jgi:Arc-like DNA binding domain